MKKIIVIALLCCTGIICRAQRFYDILTVPLNQSDLSTAPIRHDTWVSLDFSTAKSNNHNHPVYAYWVRIYKWNNRLSSYKIVVDQSCDIRIYFLKDIIEIEADKIHTLYPTGPITNMGNKEANIYDFLCHDELGESCSASIYEKAGHVSLQIAYYKDEQITYWLR